jgi:sugar lactone lactonase YvrE
MSLIPPVRVRAGLLPALVLSTALSAAVPAGGIAEHSFARSKVFPGTTRAYWVYVPPQYDPAKPACAFICQDGIAFDAPAVFDRLIAAGRMPVTIGVFVGPGRMIARSAAESDRFNRSHEFEGLGDGYARFLLEELLPDVETKRSADGRPLRLSRRGTDRMIAGAGAGALAAFTAAWERPDEFSRVLAIGAPFTGRRGADRYPTLVRKFEPRPIRIFLHGGKRIAADSAGDPWLNLQAMQQALSYAGYEHSFVWNDGPENAAHAREIFPQAIEWLWRGWPEPVRAARGSPELQDILIPGEEWQLVGEGYRFTEGPTADRAGIVFFNDIPNNKTFRLGADGVPAVVNSATNGSNGMAFGPDGRRYVVSNGTGEILAFDAAGHATVIARDLPANDIVVLHNGDVYVTKPVSKHDPATVWLVRPGQEKRQVDTGIIFPNGIAASPDQGLLYVTEFHSHWVWSFRINPDGSLAHRQRFFHLHLPDFADGSGADGLRVDRDGRIYVATRIGIQVCDREGRVTCIIPTPNGRVANVTFGGPRFDEIYATAAEKVFKRRVRTIGANAWDVPLPPPARR